MRDLIILSFLLAGCAGRVSEPETRFLLPPSSCLFVDADPGATVTTVPADQPCPPDPSELRTVAYNVLSPDSLDLQVCCSSPGACLARLALPANDTDCRDSMGAAAAHSSK